MEEEISRPTKVLCNLEDITTELDDETSTWEPIERIGCVEEQPAGFSSKETQTDYRESEAQTDPWDPPYKIIKVNKDPDVLALKELSYGNGLPATMLEVDFITQTRENKKLADALEGDNDDNSFLKRKEILKDQIKTNWKYKVAMENEVQLKRLEEMKSSLVDELSRRSEKRGYILKNMWCRKKEEMKKKHEKLEGKLRKEINAIEHRLRNIEDVDSTRVLPELVKLEDTEISVDKYVLSEENVDYLLNNFSLSNAQDLLSVKDWLEKKQSVLKNRVPLPRVSLKNQREKLTEEAYQNILSKKRTKLPPQVYHEDYKREEVAIPTAKPGSVTEFVDFDEQKIDMVTVWQQILRGLAIQKQMLQLIEKHKDGLDISLVEEIPE